MGNLACEGKELILNCTEKRVRSDSSYTINWIVPFDREVQAVKSTIDDCINCSPIISLLANQKNRIKVFSTDKIEENAGYPDYQVINGMLKIQDLNIEFNTGYYKCEIIDGLNIRESYKMLINISGKFFLCLSSN